ncbi:MAG: hypothetical protein U1E08_07785 [Coriobacteriia bacterium]|nr:hypothetical protein [Actinomycetota bacterium]MDZ4167578.1 hypothetical protein [Coriobacteriia bacterium]
MAKQGMSVKQAAEALGATPKWVRRQIAASVITPARTGNKRNGRFLLTEADVETLRALKDNASSGSDDTTALARIERLEADRANLLAQVAWARAVAQEQQKALEFERERTGALTGELEAQRARVEQLKALGAVDRLLGRHKSI